MNKLLDKPLRLFTLYAFLVLACSVPAYFAIIDYIWLNEINEHNHIVSESTKKNLQALKLNDQELKQSILLWNRLKPETQLREVSALKADSLYNLYRKNQYIPAKGYDRFQGRVSYFELNGKKYSLTVETNVEETHETILAITAVTVFFFIVLLTGFILLNKRISSRLWKPFYHSLGQIKSFDLNSQVRPVFEKTDIAEFMEMNQSLNKLIEGNIMAYRQQREFTENASHELQTPMAIVQSKLDLLLQDPSVSSRQSRLIDQIQAALSRVSRINKNLLLLARMENQQFREKERTNLTALLEEVLELSGDFAYERGLKLKTRIEENITKACNKMLFEIMVSNLLMNAVLHSEHQGSIEVLLDQQQLRISNQGSVALLEDKLFKRFSTASSQNPGTGLGLAIVREICMNHNWQVAYAFQQGRHIFSVLFAENGIQN